MAKRSKRGVCHICGELRELSFEHIPPRSIGNDKASKMYRAVDIIEMSGAFDATATDGVPYRQQQRGMGFQTLCGDCNSYLGRNYVGEYVKCIKELSCMLANNPPADGERGIHLEGRNVNVLGFFKHVVSNFCATTEAGSMNDCRRFLLNRESRDFPDKYKLFMFAIPSPKTGMLTTGWTTLLLDSEEAAYYTVAAVATFPVGFFLLDISKSSCEPDGLGCEITKFASLEWGAKPEFIVELPYMDIGKMWPVPIQS